MKHKRGYYDYFVRTCAKYPSKKAIILYEFEQYKSYTYSELYGVCEYIAQNIQQLQCARGTIGLVSERNIIIPCIIAAVHKCCTTFMFIDPTQDIEPILSHLQFNVLINISKDNQELILGLKRKPDKTIFVFGYSISFYNNEIQTNQLNQIEHSFIAKTSGSTGQPKHVQVPIRCLQPNIDDLTELFSVTSDDVIYFSTPLTFDPSMVEILLACMNGASLLVAPPSADILFPKNKEYSVTIWQTTPSLFFQQCNMSIRNKILNEKSTLRILALGGEPLNGLKTLQELKDSKNKTRIFTLYGVTEMSCWACVTELDLTKSNIDREIPLGNCLSETRLVLQPQGDNENTGKIVLVSKTRQCVILNHKEDGNSLKFVDTGDLAEMKNGTMYYRGRKDDIIKRFGCKINLQLLEHTIMQCGNIKTCSCVWLPKPMLLVAYFSSEIVGSQELSDFLKCKLDEKHWPDKIVRVNNIPTTYHGKISRLLLSAISENAETYIATPDSMKALLLQEIKNALNRNFNYEDIKDKHFFDIGGTSFIAVSMCNKISVLHSKFGKFILPLLMSGKHTMDEIMELACKEALFDFSKSRKKRKIRAGSVHQSPSMLSKRSTITNNSRVMDFSILWSHDTGKCVDASPSLFECNLHLYLAIGSHSGRVMVIDALTGLCQGFLNLNARVEAAVLCYECPPEEGCGVVGTYDGTVICFTLHECLLKWKVNIGHMVKSKAVICNGLVYVASYNGHVTIIDSTKGAIINSVAVAEEPISADLVLAKNQFLLVGTLSGVCSCIGTDINSVVWSAKVSSPIFSKPVLYDHDKYVVFAEVSGELHCKTVEKGITIWKYQGAKGNIFSSIYVKPTGPQKWHMVFGCHDKKVYSISIKNAQPCLNWKLRLGTAVYSTPCGFGSKHLLAVSKDGKMYVIHLDSGSITGEFQLPNETFSSPSVYKEYIYIGCRNDHIYCIRYNKY